MKNNNEIQIQFVPIELLEYNEGQIPAVPENPRTREDAKQRNLEKSIEDLPEMTIARAALCFPYNGRYVVIGGNRRLEAQRALKRKEVPIIALPEDTPVDKLRRMALLDNESTGQTDWAKLAKDWSKDEIRAWNIETPKGWFNEAPGKKAEEDNYTEPEKLKPRVKPGEIWQLGEHRLMCGDSTNKDDVARLMNGTVADLVFTDPPYGMKKEKEGVVNDNLNFDDLLDFNKRWIPISFQNLKENGSWYCWGIDEPLMDIYANILRPMQRENKITFRNLITWDKKNGQGQNSNEFRMYPIADEKCLFIMMGVQGFNTNADNYFDGWEPIRNYLYKSRDLMGWSVAKMKTIAGHSPKSFDHWTGKSQFCFPTKSVYERWRNEAEIERKEKNIKNEAFKKEYDELKKEYDELKKGYYDSRAYFNNTHDNMNNVWHFDRAKQEERINTGGHATPKPIALCGRAIKSSSRENELVLDLFGGSGSTMIACEQLNRKCYMMELTERYCDVIINRWETLTGRKAVKLG